jgi:hypothetical protein
VKQLAMQKPETIEKGLTGASQACDNPVSGHLDETLTARRAEVNPRVSLVYVISMREKPLMPTGNRKARKLLSMGKAKVKYLTPFTIQLTYVTGETVQPVVASIDPGYEHVGVCVITANEELYSAEVTLRTDIVKLLSEKRMYRGGRRGRKVWNRVGKSLKDTKPKGWLPPSMQHRLDSHVRIVDDLAKILPVSEVRIEVGSFDIQKLKNPDINGTDYQHGNTYGFANVREYVFWRDDYTCQNPKCNKSPFRNKNVFLQTHHIISRQIGGDRPDNLITLCKKCHDKYHEGKLDITFEIKQGYKAPTFMSIFRKRLPELLGNKGYDVVETFGYITKLKREELELEKSHLNDAFIIAGGNGQVRNKNTYYIKQVRRQNRKLHKGSRSHIKNTAPRYIQGFQRWDKIRYNGKECFINGRRQTGYFNLITLDGTKVHASAKASELRLLESAKTMLIERRSSN